MTKKSLAETVLDEIEAFLIRTGMRHTAFGLKYNGDPSLVTRLRKGRKMKADSIDAVRRFMSEYKPPRPKRRGNEPRAVA